MKKTFTLNTAPHEAEIGETTLLFKPEVYGDEFLEAYEQLRDVQRRGGVDVDDLNNVDPARLRQVTGQLRVFLAKLMLPESGEEFARWEVLVGNKTVATFHDPDEAQEAAEQRKNARVVDKGLRIPDRVLVELLEWVVELYGGGGNRPTSSSNGSAQASPTPGMRGKAASRSRG